jgi:hypothetical protein
MVNFNRVAAYCDERTNETIGNQSLWADFGSRIRAKDPVSKAFQSLLTQAEKGAFGESAINWGAVAAFCEDMAKDHPATIGQWWGMLGTRLKLAPNSPLARVVKDLIQKSAAGEFKGA